MSSLKEYIIERAYEHSSSGSVGPYQSSSKNQPWFDVVYQYMQHTFLPQLEQWEEYLVDYVPVRLVWDQQARQRQGIVDSRSMYTINSGICGTGVICFTDLQIHMAVFATLTKKYPLYEFGIGSFLRAMTRELDEIETVSRDMTWNIPYSDVLAVTAAVNKRQRQMVRLVTPGMDWEIHNPFPNGEDFLTTAIAMGRSGELYDLWEDEEEASGDRE